MAENRFAEAEDIPQLIHQLVGAASTCWIGGTGDKEFWTAEAGKVAGEAITRLNELGCGCVPVFPKASQVPDTLRDRIIKAIGAEVYGDIGNSDLSLATRAADAVIAALGLHHETDNLIAAVNAAHDRKTVSDTLRDRIAAVQREHRLGRSVIGEPDYHCACGWRSPEHDCTCWPFMVSKDSAADYARYRAHRTDHPEHVADAVIEALPVIKALPQQVEWRADFGYDGYAKCETRDEARVRVDEFNAALGDDVRDGEQAMVMHRFVTDWCADE